MFFKKVLLWQHLVSNTGYSLYVVLLCKCGIYNFVISILFGLYAINVELEHEAKLDRNEMSMLRWMCGFNVKDCKKNMEVRELLGLRPVSLSVRRSRLRWFGHKLMEV